MYLMKNSRLHAECRDILHFVIQLIEMKKTTLQRISSLFQSYPEIKLAYLFGSQAKGKVGKLSDYDFAIYLKEPISPVRKFQIIGGLTADLMQSLQTNDIDLVAINSVHNLSLVYDIIATGVLLYQEEPYKPLVETQYLSQYLDFQVFQQTHDLV